MEWKFIRLAKVKREKKVNKKKNKQSRDDLGMLYYALIITCDYKWRKTFRFIKLFICFEFWKRTTKNIKSQEVLSLVGLSITI